MAKMMEGAEGGQLYVPHYQTLKTPDVYHKQKLDAQTETWWIMVWLRPVWWKLLIINLQPKSIYLLNSRWLVFSSHTCQLKAAVNSLPCLWRESCLLRAYLKLIYCVFQADCFSVFQYCLSASSAATQPSHLSDNSNIQKKASFLNCFQKCIHLQAFSRWLTLICVFLKPKMTTRKWFTLHTEDGLSYFIKPILNCIQLCQLALDKSRYWTSLRTVPTL